MQQITHSIFPGYEWEKIVSMFEKVAVILLLTVLGSLLLKVFEIQVWRHDAIMMFSDYFWKMRAEGRWINYFIFPLLQNVNPHFSIVVAEICVFYFAYVVAIRLISFKRIAFLFALLACQLPSLYSIIGWPITVMPSFLALAFFAYVSNKVQPSVVFILGGIVFFGLFNNFYNLLLLLYVGKISHSNIKKGISLLFLWVVSYLIGYIFMLCVCKVLTGDWGLAIESWRKPNPIHSYSDLIDNLSRIFFDFKHQFTYVSWKVTLVSFVIVIWGAGYRFLSERKSEGISGLWIVMLVLIVMASGFAQSIPYGLGVGTRTAVFFFFAIFLLHLQTYKYCRLYGIVALVAVALIAYLKNYDSICFYTGVTNVWRNAALEMNINPAAVNVVHICSSNNQIAESERMIVNNLQLKNYHNQGFSTAQRQYPVFHSLGFRHFDAQNQKCNITQPRNSNAIYEWTLLGRELFVWYK